VYEKPTGTKYAVIYRTLAEEPQEVLPRNSLCAN
jgi:hypothetical protein